MIDLESLKYPIGKYRFPLDSGPGNHGKWIEDIRSLPERMHESIRELSAQELNWIYRPDGWNIKQVVHHCADSHMNGYVRLKLALTEDTPTIKPYTEALWAKTADANDNDLSNSMKILEGLHARWADAFSNMTADQYKREFMHPESNRTMSLDKHLALYAWHGNHHLAHILQAIKYKGKF